jgi:hypothetical protein
MYGDMEVHLRVFRIRHRKREYEASAVSIPVENAFRKFEPI